MLQWMALTALTDEAAMTGGVTCVAAGGAIAARDCVCLR